MANNNQIYKMSNAGGFKSLTRYYDMLAGNTTWNPWEPQGAFDALATVTVPSGGVATITFAGIPQNYKHLQIRALARGTAATINLPVFLRYNSDSTASNYFWHRLSGDGSTATAAANSASETKIYIGTMQGSNVSGYNGIVADLLDYTSVTKTKTIRSLFGCDSNGAGVVGLSSGAWVTSSAAVTNITLLPQYGNFEQHTQFALYGVK